jgi:hypothetical protein
MIAQRRRRSAAKGDTNMHWMWTRWIRENWAALVRGSMLHVAEGQLGHPARLPGLFKPAAGFPDGQTCDYVMPLDDGSRVHVQCYRSANGIPLLRVHRDRWDPDRDVGSFMLHALLETPVGPALAGLALIGLVSR